MNALNLTPTRDAGLERLKAFAPDAGRRYAARRNFDSGPKDHGEVSVLSPWISHRLVAEWEVLETVIDAHGPKAAEKFIQEVCWRSYWKGWLEMRPQIWAGYRNAVETARRQAGLDNELAAALDRATRGDSGITCFDHWASELIDTGYLHNHARMWFASIWIFTLELPWALGADFFYRHLVDGDPASNTLSWRWVAGLQTVGKHYLARPDNIEKFTCEGIEAPDQLNVEAAPLQADEDREPRPVARGDALPTAGRWGLLLCDHDLWLSERLTGAAVATASLSLLGRRSDQPPGDRLEAFASGALDDARSRAVASGLADGGLLPDLEAVVNWAREASLHGLIIAWPTVGPAREVAEEVSALLAQHGLALARIQRDWDQKTWPHARKGFFAFGKHIPDLLKSLHNPE